jgi:hypothetical protein
MVMPKLSLALKLPPHNHQSPDLAGGLVTPINKGVTKNPDPLQLTILGGIKGKILMNLDGLKILWPGRKEKQNSKMGTRGDQIPKQMGSQTPKGGPGRRPRALPRFVPWSA